MVDIESDGPAPGIYSMIEIGIIKMQQDLQHAPVFHRKLRPISDNFVPSALEVTGYTREETMEFKDPMTVMQELALWLEWNNQGKGPPIFIADNNGFDFAFVNYYCWKFLGHNPFGHSSRNLGDLYKGLMRDTKKNFKHLRKTKHTHNPVDDARGNAEAFLALRGLGLNILFEDNEVIPTSVVLKS
jgi:DNA polymerase III epsilon subunit-like protein